MKCALVTGANRGIGFEVARALLDDGVKVIVCGRRFQQAADTAGLLGKGALALALDLDERGCVDDAVRFVEENAGGGLDILVNNAGVSLDGTPGDVAEATLRVNAWGPARLTDGLRPLLAEGACVVMVSSSQGNVGRFDDKMSRRLLADEMNRTELHQIGAEFIEAAKRDRLLAAGFPNSSYAVSKALLNGVTRIFAKEWGTSGPRVNAVCPGWVRTRMVGERDTRSPKRAAEGIDCASQLPPGGPTGTFFRDVEALSL